MYCIEKQYSWQLNYRYFYLLASIVSFLCEMTPIKTIEETDSNTLIAY